MENTPEKPLKERIVDYLCAQYNIVGRSYNEIAEKGGIATSSVFKFFKRETKSYTFDTLESIIIGMGLNVDQVFRDIVAGNLEDKIAESIVNDDKNEKFNRETLENTIKYEHELREISRWESAWHRKTIGELKQMVRQASIEKWICFGCMIVVILVVIIYLAVQAGIL